MRWRTGRRSANVEDRRGMRGGRGFPAPVMLGGGGGCVVLLVLVVGMWLGIDPLQLLQGLPTSEVQAPYQEDPGVSAPGAPGAPVDEGADFVSVVLADTEDVWNEIFRRAGQSYEEPTLVLFSDAVSSACGFAQAAVGPFYCPADRKLYLDLTFFEELRRRFRAPGDFAQAYVVAHEVGHHVQNLLGIAQQVQEAQRASDRRQANALSVLMELQADCFAGAWAFHAQRMRNLLEPGDLEEGLAAAAAIGDDRIQRETQGRVVPDAFTHGTSAQRVEWFRVGFQQGDFRACDTFAVE